MHELPRRQVRRLLLDGPLATARHLFRPVEAHGVVDQQLFLPISATMLALAGAAIVVVLLPSLRKKRDEAFQEDD